MNNDNRNKVSPQPRTLEPEEEKLRHNREVVIKVEKMKRGEAPSRRSRGQARPGRQGTGQAGRPSQGKKSREIPGKH